VVRAEADRRELPIVLELDPGLPVVLGDRVQLQQVLLNLLMNAFEAMVDVTDGPRTVTVRSQTLAGDQVRVDVADTGPGIATETLGTMFKPFVTTKAGGMGIGLSVSDSIVRAHAGRLSAENLPKGGAVLHMTLPTGADETASAG
jgi:C4-dicarboxylate-specific signal transduction histidine kinase